MSSESIAGASAAAAGVVPCTTGSEASLADSAHERLSAEVGARVAAAGVTFAA
jgi:hypothetical protein